VKYNKLFLIVGGMALVPVVLWELLLLWVSTGNDNNNGGLLGIGLGLASLLLASIFVLCALPFIWLTTWLFAPLVFPNEQLPYTPSKIRIIVSYFWVSLCGLIAGGSLYLLHHAQAFLPLYAKLHATGGVYLAGSSGFVIGLIVPSFYLGIRTMYVLKRRDIKLNLVYIYALLSLLTSCILLIYFHKIDTQAEAQIKFTVYTPNTITSKQYPVFHEKLDTLWPDRIRIRINDASSTYLAETATTATDAYNLKTQSCVPPPFTDKSFSIQHDCEYKTTTKSGTRIYEGKNLRSYFVIKGTYFKYDGHADTNFVDSLVPGEISGGTIQPAAGIAPLHLKVYVPTGYAIPEIKLIQDKKEITVPISYPNHSGSAVITEQYTNQTSPICIKPRYYGDTPCHKAFLTPNNREVYVVDDSLTYGLVIDHTNIEIWNIQSPQKDDNGKRIIYGASQNEVMKFIDSLQLQE
jgi:hypothetical protein